MSIRKTKIKAVSYASMAPKEITTALGLFAENKERFIQVWKGGLRLGTVKPTTYNGTNGYVRGLDGTIYTFLMLKTTSNTFFFEIGYDKDYYDTGKYELDTLEDIRNIHKKLR